MSIRAIIINVVLPLAITVIGGIILYHYSNQLNERPRLTYSMSEAAHFDLAGEIITTNNVAISNNLEDRINSVVATLTYDNPIDELSVSDDSNKTITYIEELSEDQLSATITIPHLRSNETFRFRTFAQSGSTLSPTIVVQSESHVATLDENAINIGGLQDTIGRSAIFITAISALTALLSAVAVRKFLPRLFSELFDSRSANNTGFVLLHLGLVDKALSIFERSIDKNGASAYELSNLALCYAMQEDFKTANTYLLASEFLVNNDKHPIIMLNQGLTNYLEGDKLNAKEILSLYKTKHRRPYNHYIKFSKPLKMAESDLNL